jgi:hypothetical protein
VLLRLTYIAVTNAFAALRLLPMSDRDKDAEILALRHQLAVRQRQLGPARTSFAGGLRVKRRRAAARRRSRRWGTRATGCATGAPKAPSA